jgi:murein DD-endopeptidase MepM/ murein hydrolase activator NlpD
VETRRANVHDAVVGLPSRGVVTILVFMSGDTGSGLVASSAKRRPRRPVLPLLLGVAMAATLLVGVGRSATNDGQIVEVAAPAPVTNATHSSVAASSAAVGQVFAQKAADVAMREATAKAQARAKAQAAKERKARKEAARKASRFTRVVYPTRGRISATFGERGGRWGKGWHTGLDFRAPVGTPVNSIQYGTVTFAGFDRAYGRKIVVKHTNGVLSAYAHLSQIHVRVGQTVDAGELIGRVGRSGNTTGPHLHLEVIKGDQQVNPMGYLRKTR